MVGRDIITISGDLGSGKTMVSKLLCDALGYEIYSTGLLQRQIAEEKGMNTLEMNRFSEHNKKIDELIDQRTKKYGETKNSLVFDSRMAWYFIPTSFKTYLFVDKKTAVERIQKDKKRKSESYSNFNEAQKAILARRTSEKNRFKNLYDVEIDLFVHYNLVIDTSFSTPEQVSQVILDAFSRKKQFSPSSCVFFASPFWQEKMNQKHLRDSFSWQSVYDAVDEKKVDRSELLIPCVIR